MLEPCSAHTEKQQENDTDEAVAHAVTCMKCVFHASEIDKQNACEQYEHRADGGGSAYHTPHEQIAFPKTCIGRCVPKYECFARQCTWKGLKYILVGSTQTLSKHCLGSTCLELHFGISMCQPIHLELLVFA